MFWTLCEVLWLARNCGFYDQTSRSADHSGITTGNAELPSSHRLVLRLISYNKDPSCRRLLLCPLNTTPCPGLAKSTNYVPWECNPRYRSPHGAETISMIGSSHRVQPGYNTVLFVDDTSIIVKSHTRKDFQTNMVKAFDSANKLFKVNSLSINVKKNPLHPI